ncbi:MAG: hypothetical protein ABI551_12330, partial [Polyangiaceae bacterium]
MRDASAQRLMALDPIKGGLFMLLMFGFTRSVYKRIEDYAVRKDAKKIFDARKALYTEMPGCRLLEDDELTEDRASLADVAHALEGFTPMGDYVDVYTPDSRFGEDAKRPYRVMRSDDGLVVALLFRPRGSEAVRVHLLTELTGGGWLVTENNRNGPTAKQKRPDGAETDHLPGETPPSKLVEAHRSHVKAALTKPGASAVTIDSFEAYVASHERRWNEIREDRKKNGWVRPGEIVFPPRVKERVR